MSNIKEIDPLKASSLDDFLALSQPLGSVDRAVGNNLYGINHQGIRGIIPENRDTYGYTFLTRPQLNLSSSNIRNDRRFYSLLTKKGLSIQRYIRCMLDPKLHYRHNLTSPLVDPQLAFIPILSNNISNMSGWPDIVSPTFTSKKGLRREEWSIVDGNIDIYDSYSLDCTFKNTKDEPIILMLMTWIYYMSLVFDGTFSPYLTMFAENEIDYNTRIYRLVMDETKTYVKKMSATGASFPVNVPTGRFFDFSDTNKYNDQNKDINVRFQCMGAIYNDDILVREFNTTSAQFNNDVKLMLAGKSHNLEKIPQSLMVYFNNRGYPIINETTLELEWWINKNSLTYKYLMSKLATE